MKLATLTGQWPFEISRLTPESTPMPPEVGSKLRGCQELHHCPGACSCFPLFFFFGRGWLQGNFLPLWLAFTGKPTQETVDTKPVFWNPHVWEIGFPFHEPFNKGSVKRRRTTKGRPSRRVFSGASSDQQILGSRSSQPSPGRRTSSGTGSWGSGSGTRTDFRGECAGC